MYLPTEWGPRTRETTLLRDSASDPARGLGAMYDPASLYDSSRASVPGRWNYSKSLSDLTQGFRVGVIESGSIAMAISRWLRAGTLRGSVQQGCWLGAQAFGQTRVKNQFFNP